MKLKFLLCINYSATQVICILLAFWKVKRIVAVHSRSCLKLSWEHWEDLWDLGRSWKRKLKVSSNNRIMNWSFSRSSHRPRPVINFNESLFFSTSLLSHVMRESSLLYHPPRNFFFFNEPAQICATCLFMNCFVWKHWKKLLSIAAERLWMLFLSLLMMFVTLFRQPSAVTFWFYEWKKREFRDCTRLSGGKLRTRCKVYHMAWRTQGACFAYFSRWIICCYSWRSLTRCILRRFIVVSWIRNVIIFRVIATCNLRSFFSSCFSCRFHLMLSQDSAARKTIVSLSAQ